MWDNMDALQMSMNDLVQGKVTNIVKMWNSILLLFCQSSKATGHLILTLPILVSEKKENNVNSTSAAFYGDTRTTYTELVLGIADLFIPKSTHV